MIEILAITSATEDCGIRQYGNYLRDHLPGDCSYRDSLGVEGSAVGDWLDPSVFFRDLPRLQEYQGPQMVWLNFHAALHSRWTGDLILKLRWEGLPVVVTFHDTGVPNSLQCLDIYRNTIGEGDLTRSWGRGAFIVHEPCPDLPEAIYLRQGIPSWQPAMDHPLARRRPLLGTVGFPFPWKNYDLLADATAEAGWSLLLLAPRATDAQIYRWRGLNSNTVVVPVFQPADTIVSQLAGCDATAFLYTCANTGTSGAVRQGIAARKPVFVTEGCRQFRDLWEDQSVGRWALRWVSDLTPTGIAGALGHLPLGRLDPRIVRLAERDSWAKQALQYSILFRHAAGVAAV